MSTLTDLADALSLLNDDERLVMLAIAQRLLKGQRQYGALELTTDTRDWRREAGEEMADALVYLACHDLSSRKRDTWPSRSVEALYPDTVGEWLEEWCAEQGYALRRVT